MDRMTVRAQHGVLMSSGWDFHIDPDDYDLVQNILARLAAYEDTGLDPENMSHWKEMFLAECDGRLLILPCKVGDTVYTRNHRGRIVDGKVVSIHENLSLLGAGGFVFTVNYPEYNGTAESGLNPEFLPSRGIYRNGDFGETVFLTREEAEAAIAKDTNVPTSKDAAHTNVGSKGGTDG